MGYSGKLFLHEKARELRLKGYSVRTIQKKLGVAKSSVSLWVRNIMLSDKQTQQLLNSKRAGGKKGSILAAKRKIINKEKQIKEITLKANKEIGTLTQKEKFFFGLALYFAEGDKKGHNVAFTNSDPEAIKFMANWFRDFCKVKSDKMRCYIYLHENLDEKNARNYWLKTTKIPLDQFRKTYRVSNTKKTFRKTKYIYGICRISISDVNLLRRILGWISGVFNV
ncbi:hypothetical protein A2334_06210 [Candidatus Roizmanbacteria bacterium RIFOXYB2_FULL_38_10]|uniref:Uncharacterized protein n=1 Tax=Candidatus Roizmanbacteria bacterium RIFOXYD1_FULL_38_12 TaxID=1802093 RepID=A0A1F7L200_9BACT|nr:MAG: hypothetical protein A3K47_05210 [Candidatus Roizmanbacteria bacterium RIFOXYA2_FULL_38_14]OGK64144.1 MAG: hypothetical protein A3K27_05210 [Candidatus Roizmanbacteria bacterium RIFOXYA1_FULL_37_12]OGK65990.1 MAG: hypothetical protein A3K38_05210 [Candidatus Roizmanbacteria bacterium RIFOXYB1_FULL_40_23]OGK68437.1 MAG: hypothetical protein A2334_06210 [Candidatus Roizmanbacteria bacterium RIFOXYB2_FULL_38_10]OGK70395.1 MAG: hypothetical protein A3K21_05215 [Candidatus Roizmanbacteria ba